MQPSELSSVLTMIRASHDYFVYTEANHFIRKKKSVLNFVDNFEMSNANGIKGFFIFYFEIFYFIFPFFTRIEQFLEKCDLF